MLADVACLVKEPGSDINWVRDKLGGVTKRSLAIMPLGDIRRQVLACTTLRTLITKESVIHEKGGWGDRNE